MASAQNDMREIYRYIADELQNPDAAAKRISLIQNHIALLKENPACCPLVRDDYLAAKGFRLLQIKTHAVFYIIRENERAVSIMRVLLGRRDWMRLLKNETFDENGDNEMR
jgi:toxin ParE1/3/4